MTDARDEAFAAELRDLGYELVELLGSGGMGRVWRARERILARDVALKLIGDTSDNPRAKQRFVVEARALARISHPNVVAVYTLGEAAGEPFLAYELVEGTSIDQLLDSLDWPRALAIGLDLARGLAAAHEAGVLHRDLKPSNAMVTREGVGKLIDFGLAKLLRDDGAQTFTAGELAPDGSALDDSSPGQARPPRALDRPVGPDATLDLPEDEDLSASGSVQLARSHGGLLGTPRYIAPEQWRGASASARTDVYTLGLLLWEMLCRRRVYAGLDQFELVEAILNRPLASPCSVEPTVPAALSRVVERAVDKRPSARQSSAAELVIELERARDELRAHARASLRRQAPTQAPSAALGLGAPPVTRWTRAGATSIALQTFGAGPERLLFIPGWVSHCELAWRLPAYASFMARLAALASVSVFDKRGTGMSDRMNYAAPLEARVADIRAVLDAAEHDDAVLVGAGDGGALAAAYAALDPERVRGLIWLGAGRAAGLGPGLDDARAAIERGWGSPLFAELHAPSRAEDPAFTSWWADYLRNGASPSVARWLLEHDGAAELDALLPGVGVPTAIVHRVGDRVAPLAGARGLAGQIAGAELVELPGEDHLPWLGDPDPLLAAIASFCSRLAGLERRDLRLHARLIVRAKASVELPSTLPPPDGEGIVSLELAGPVAAIERGLALVDAGLITSGLVDLVAGTRAQADASAIQRRGQLMALAAGSVAATTNAATLSRGARLRFVALADDLQLATASAP